MGAVGGLLPASVGEQAACAITAVMTAALRKHHGRKHEMRKLVMRELVMRELVARELMPREL